MGTIRKKATGLPTSLLTAKGLNQALVWDSTLAKPVVHCLCFYLQDNNAVLGITTAFSPHRPEDRVVVNRKRPKPSSTNARVVRPVFSEQTRKQLSIPEAVNAYNCYMKAIDCASQLRNGFTCHRRQEQCWWGPLFYWLFDTCADNAFLLSRGPNASRGKRDHSRFLEGLISTLLATPTDQPIDGLLSQHQAIRLKKATYCYYGRKQPRECVQGQNRKRRFGDEIVNESRPNTRPRSVTRSPYRRRNVCWLPKTIVMLFI